MKKQATHHPHTFVANMFGSLGYVAMVFLWLLVFDLIVILTSLGGLVENVSTSIGTLASSTYVAETTAQSGTSSSHLPLKFLLGVILLVLVWVFGYLTARASSRLLRHVLILLRRKPTLHLLVLAKYLVTAMGLIGLVVLLQFVPSLYDGAKSPIAFLGLAGGVVAVGSIWAQKVLAARYELKVERVL